MNTNREEIKQKCIQSIDKIFNEYNEEIVFKKIQQYICINMPIVVNKYNNDLIIKVDLTTEQDYFVEFFLNQNQYFYIKPTNKYFFYNNSNFKIIYEDDLLYKILTTISSSDSKLLRPWKQKTKNEIMKRIRNRNLLTFIPESNTIQTIFSGFMEMHMFNNKNNIKYFLTVLGDNILKKNNNLIHILPPEAKDFITEISNYCYVNFGCNSNNSIKYKFYEHSFANTRLFNNHFFTIDETKWQPFLFTHHIGIICLACHYSNKYSNSDNCLFENNMDDSFIDHVLYLKELSPSDIISDFINNYIEMTIEPIDMQTTLIPTNSDIAQINMKEMLYLWKHYLDCKQIPSVIFINTFKSEIIKRYSGYYNLDLDSFIGLSSKHLPIIQLFLEYWNSNIKIDTLTDYEFEISEIILLFKKWVITNYNNTIINISEKKVIDILSYFLSDITICDNKYLLQITCDLWDKNNDILVSVDSFIDNMKNKYSNIKGKLVPIYDIYNYYCSINKETKLIVKKNYFEKVLQDNYDKQYVLENENPFLIIDI